MVAITRTGPNYAKEEKSGKKKERRHPAIKEHVSGVDVRSRDRCMDRMQLRVEPSVHRHIPREVRSKLKAWATSAPP